MTITRHARFVVSYKRLALVSELNQYLIGFWVLSDSPAIIHIQLKHRKHLYSVLFAPSRAVMPLPAKKSTSVKASSLHWVFSRSARRERAGLFGFFVNGDAVLVKFDINHLKTLPRPKYDFNPVGFCCVLTSLMELVVVVCDALTKRLGRETWPW